MIREIIETFLPWLLYLILSGHSDGQMRIAIAAAAIVSLFSERKGLRKGFILSWVTFLFFAFMFFAVIINDNAWVMRHAWVLSNAALAFVSWVSILLKRPFTLQYAKEKVSADKWNHPLFIKINYILTITWGSIFTFCMIVNMLRLHPVMELWIYEVLSDAATVFGIWFTVWFPEYYKARSIKQ